MKRAIFAVLAATFVIATLTACDPPVAYEDRACESFANEPINRVPARCASHFGVTTTQNGAQ